MQKKGENIRLNTYDDIFSTEQSRAEDKMEKVREIPLSELHPFKNHPFKVLDDEAMSYPGSQNITEFPWNRSAGTMSCPSS